MKLLTKENPKTIKGESLGYVTYILYMSPFTFNSKGINLCSHASKGCAESCLVGSGFGGMFPSVKTTRMERTELFLGDRKAFFERLHAEISAARRKSNGGPSLCVRLNGTSDIPYEKHRVYDGKNVFEEFPDVQFYDYTKNHLRFFRELPSNYHLTFSRSESNHEMAMELLMNGVNVAMVFDELPKTYQGYKVINADESDLRFLDERGVICGLKYKKMTGKGADNTKAFKSGFIITSGIKVNKKLTTKDLYEQSNRTLAPVVVGQV